MIYIDPSELRETSQLLKYLSDVVYTSLPDLEAITGADVMISPDSLPSPFTEKLLQLHVDNGCKLIQLKFGHDLPSSIVDGRLNEALSRMQRAGASQWQSVLLFIGLLGYEETDKMATINGQLTYGSYPMKWINVDSALDRWVDRGGSLAFPIPSGKLIKARFEGIQARLNEYVDKPIKQIWPNKAVFTETIEPNNPYLRKWRIGQKIEVIEDIRPMICAIPGVRIGEVKATGILKFMEENNIRQDFSGFLKIVKNGEILKVPGIGNKILDDINWGLFRTLDERNKRNE